MAWKGRVFTNAYVVPSGVQRGASMIAHVADAVLDHVWAHGAGIVEVAERTRSWEATAVHMAEALPWGFGAPATSFFAKEILHDMALCGRFEFDDRDTWCPVRPGARRGLNWVHGRKEGARGKWRLDEMRALLALARASMPPPARATHSPSFATPNSTSGSARSSSCAVVASIRKYFR